MADAWTVQDEAANYRRGHLGIPPFAVESLLKYYLIFFADRQRIPLAIDVGCGSGQFTFPLSKVCNKVIGIDISAEQINEAKKALEESDDIQKEKIEFRVGSALDLSKLAYLNPDVIAAYSVLQHLDHKRFIREACCALRPGGTLALFVWSLIGFPDLDEKVHEEYLKFRKLLLSQCPTSHNMGDVPQFYRDLKIPLDDRTCEEETFEIEVSREKFEQFLRSYSFFIVCQRKNHEEAEKIMSNFLQTVWSHSGDQTNVKLKVLVVSVFGRKVIF